MYMYWAFMNLKSIFWSSASIFFLHLRVGTIYFTITAHSYHFTGLLCSTATSAEQHRVKKDLTLTHIRSLERHPIHSFQAATALPH